MFDRVISALIFSVVCFCMSAQNRLDTIQQLKEVEVIAKRNVEIIPVQTLSGKTLETLSAYSVADALRYFSGVQLKDYGGVGGIKTVNIRSMGSQHVGVFYDGVEIGNAQNGVVDLGRFSLDNMEAISLYNGQKSAIFQPAKDFASASSIYMNTKKPVFRNEKSYNAKAAFKTGSFDLINPSILWEQKLSPTISSSLNADYVQSSGKYKFTYKVVNKNDERGGYDTTAVRQNGDIKIFRIEQALWGAIKKGEWKTRAYFYSSDRAYPGAVVKEEPGRFKHEDRQEDKNFFVQGNLKRQMTDKYTTQLTAKYAYDYIYYESDTLILKLRNTYKINDFYLSSANVVHLLPYWSVNVSADFQYNKMNSDIKEFIYPERYAGWVVGATSLNFDRFKMQASLLATFVQEKTKEERTVPQSWQKLTPAIMASYQPLRTENFFLRAFYKDIFRMPTFNEMYLAYMGSLSSALKPESTKQYNWGMQYTKQLKNISFESQIDAYYNEVHNKILAVPGGVNFRWTMKNLGLVEIRGIDFSFGANARLTDDFLLSTRLNYTFQKAQDFTPPSGLSDSISNYYGGQISYIPWHSGSAVVSASYKTWSLNYSFIYTGERYTWSANIPANKLQPWYTHDLSLAKSFKWQKNDIKLTAEVNNLFNQQYDVVLNYPMPGTNFKLIASVGF